VVGRMDLQVTPENTIFALDIGTRTVIGLVAVPEEGRLRVAAEHAVEHPRRTMFDGQIHDIPAVAATVREVREELEARLGFRLHRVALAAAGRSLLTRRYRVTREVGEAEIDEKFLSAMEMAAVRGAQEELLAELAAAPEDYACVGYSVAAYRLDGYPLASLAGHRGKVAEADVIATFLPASVVNGLYAVLARAGLEPLHLTLEPMAAVEVAVPEGQRLLNLALVDIGAGTSDVAVTRDGAIVAYAMVPLAGDEVTEEIMQACLVDFDTAEGIKRKLGREREIRFCDVTGMEQCLATEELLSLIDPALERLAGEVAGAVLGANGGRPPRAVFCVGGGSQVPGLTEKIARHLNLDAARVVVRSRRSLGPVICGTEGGLDGPEGVTVAGIAVTALRRLGHDFLHVVVNGREHRLFNAGGFTVARVLALTGFDPRQLVGRHGRDLIFTLNGREHVIYGEPARPARLFVNDFPATMQTRVRHGDRVTVEPAADGADARCTAGELLPADGLVRIALDGCELALEGLCLVNGEPAAPGRLLREGDTVEICAALTLEEIAAEYAGRPLSDVMITVNGEPADPTCRPRQGDRVELVPAEAAGNLPDPWGAQDITVRVNGRPVTLTGRSRYIFVDALARVELDLSRVRPPVLLLLNGRPAGLTDELRDGDEVEVSSGGA
ncbi:MAG: cell division protein FtsA, partial [Desulfotomaculales bacterium]